MLCSKAIGIQLKIRSGGHDDYDGISYEPFIILDMFNLRSITLDMATTWVQAGATLRELYHKIASASKIHGFPAGVYPIVGVGGHLSGGGYGKQHLENWILGDGCAANNIWEIGNQIVRLGFGFYCP